MLLNFGDCKDGISESECMAICKKRIVIFLSNCKAMPTRIANEFAAGPTFFMEK